MLGCSRGSYRLFLRTVLKSVLGDFIPGYLTFARRCKWQIPPIIPNCFEAILCRLPFRVMSLLHGGARESYLQFCRTVLRPFLGDFNSGHLIFACGCKGQLPPICSDCLEDTLCRSPFRVMSLLHGGARGSGLSEASLSRLPFRVNPIWHDGARGNYGQFFGLSSGQSLSITLSGNVII